MRVAFRSIIALLAVTGAVAVFVALWFLSRGIATRDEPAALEMSLASAARHYAISSAARSRPNPVVVSPEVLRAGLEHWADHCALCHGNDGSGETTVGRALYPRAPDMRQRATQDLTDGELFYIIENGVKITGMPAWGTGTPDGELASWHLVHFIRHLPQVTDEELSEMNDLNPRGPAEWQALEEERKFLAGEPEAPPVQPLHGHRH